MDLTLQSVHMYLWCSTSRSNGVPNHSGMSFNVVMALVQSNFFCKKIQNFATKIQIFCKIYRAFQCFSVQYREQF